MTKNNFLYLLFVHLFMKQLFHKQMKRREGIMSRAFLLIAFGLVVNMFGVSGALATKEEAKQNFDRLKKDWIDSGLVTEGVIAKNNTLKFWNDNLEGKSYASWAKSFADELANVFGPFPLKKGQCEGLTKSSPDLSNNCSNSLRMALIYEAQLKKAKDFNMEEQKKSAADQKKRQALLSAPPSVPIPARPRSNAVVSKLPGSGPVTGAPKQGSPLSARMQADRK